jgi:hypothetical protein
MSGVGSSRSEASWPVSVAVDNPPSLGVGTPVATPRWSIGWWFMPFANFVMPYRIVQDLDDLTAEEATYGSRLVLAWWLTFLLAYVLGKYVARLFPLKTIDDLQTKLVVNLSVEALAVVAAVLAIMMIRRMQANAELLAGVG